MLLSFSHFSVSPNRASLSFFCDSNARKLAAPYEYFELEGRDTACASSLNKTWNAMWKKTDDKVVSESRQPDTEILQFSELDLKWRHCHYGQKCEGRHFSIRCLLVLKRRKGAFTLKTVEKSTDYVSNIWGKTDKILLKCNAFVSHFYQSEILVKLKQDNIRGQTDKILLLCHEFMSHFNPSEDDKTSIWNIMHKRYW